MLGSVLRNDDQEVASRRARANDLLSWIDGSTRITAVRSLTDGESGFLRFALSDTTGRLVARPPFGVLRGYPLTLEEHEQLQPMLAQGERAGKGSVLLRDRLFTLPTHSRVGTRDLMRLRHWLVTPSWEGLRLVMSRWALRVRAFLPFGIRPHGFSSGCAAFQIVYFTDDVTRQFAIASPAWIGRAVCWWSAMATSVGARISKAFWNARYLTFASDQRGLSARVRQFLSSRSRSARSAV
jgi:hypothetical protein